ncbi:MAG: YHS domain-containing protein, partial [bacterium]
MAIDPVCGMTVDEARAAATFTHQGQTYYFCAPGCKRTFEADPERVLREGPQGMGGTTSQPVQLVRLSPARTKGDGHRADAEPVPTTATGRANQSLTIPIEG